MSLYRDQVIDFKPLRARPEDSEVTVRSEIRQRGQQPLALDYDMEKTPQGWKVYDVVIAGVSLVQNYRSTFNSEIQKNGIDGLITSLTAKNKTLAQQTAKK